MKKFWPLLIVVAQRLWYYHAFPHCSEDAYITFHSVKDWDWMKACTSPIYALVMHIGTQPEVLARFLALSGDMLACYVAVKTLDRWGGYLFCLLWSLPFFSGSSLSGLETHLVACAAVVSFKWPQALLAGCLRPDSAVQFLVIGWKRWKWQVGAGLALVLATWITTGQPMPATIGAKLLSYSVAWCRGWTWLHPQGFGWLMWPLFAAALLTRRWVYILGAMAPIAAWWFLAVPAFWWYAVPSLAILSYLACAYPNRLLRLGLAIVALVVWQGQFKVLGLRAGQEAELWKFGERFAALKPEGMLFLEPAGIIPYLNPQMTIVDEVGLTCPSLAKRRAQGDGWYTDAIETLRPEWIITRTAFLIKPHEYYVGVYKPLRDEQDLRSAFWNYDIKLIPDREAGWNGNKLGIRYSSGMYVAMKKLK